MNITVLSARATDGHIRAVVRADSPPRAAIHLLLNFPITGQTEIWTAAREEALRYLDLA